MDLQYSSIDTSRYLVYLITFARPTLMLSLLILQLPIIFLMMMLCSFLLFFFSFFLFSEAVEITVSHTLQQWKALKNRTPVHHHKEVGAATLSCSILFCPPYLPCRSCPALSCFYLDKLVPTPLRCAALTFAHTHTHAHAHAHAHEHAHTHTHTNMQHIVSTVPALTPTPTRTLTLTPDFILSKLPKNSARCVITRLLYCLSILYHYLVLKLLFITRQNGAITDGDSTGGVKGGGVGGNHQINEVVLVGGSSRSPEVREMVRRALVLEGFSDYSLPSSLPKSSTAASSSSSSSSSASQELHHTSSRTRSDGKGSLQTV